MTDVALTATIVAGLLDAVPDGLLMIDEAGRMLLVNSRIEELFGYSRGELLGEQVEVLLPEEHRQAHPRLRQSYTVEPSIRPMGVSLSLHGRRRDGTEFPVEISLSPLTAAGRWTVAAVRDDAARQSVEEHRREAAVSAEQARIAQDLAETVIRSLFGTGLQLQGVLERPGDIRAGVREAIDSIDRTIRDVRAAIFDLAEHRTAVDRPGAS